MLIQARSTRKLLVVVTAAVCSIAACSAPLPRSPVQRAADVDTAAEVQAALAADQNLFGRDIVVSVQDGVVNLSGLAWSDDDTQTAGRIAGSIVGV